MRVASYIRGVEFIQRNIAYLGLLLVTALSVLLLANQDKLELMPTTLFSATTVLLSYFAYRFSAERFRLDLLDRRWVIYEGVLEFCSRVTAQGGLSFDERSREETLKAVDTAQQSFRGIGWHKSKALFGSDVIGLLEKLNKSFAWLSAHDRGPSDPAKRSEWSEDWERHALFVFETANSLPEIFKPYVYFGNYKKM
jgi:hypothetical protein